MTDTKEKDRPQEDTWGGQQDMIDPATGIRLTPSIHGVDCLGNGERPGLECCCDECDWYTTCFPDWETALGQTRKI